MKNILLLLCVGCVIHSNAQRKEAGSLIMENIPDVPTELTEQMNKYQNTRAAGFSGWDPAGEAMLITTRFGETNQLHLVNHPMGARKQITFFKEPVTGGSFCPDPKYPGFMFRKDVGGNEFAQLYWFDLLSGNYFMVSDGGRTQNGGPLWSNKGDRFVYTSTRRNMKDYDLYLSLMTSPAQAKQILEVSGSWGPMDWSPDDKKILVRNYISANSSRLFILDMESGKLDSVRPSAEAIAYNDAAWSADGKGIFMVNDEGTEFQVLKYYDLATKKIRPISLYLEWDV